VSSISTPATKPATPIDKRTARSRKTRRSKGATGDRVSQAGITRVERDASVATSTNPRGGEEMARVGIADSPIQAEHINASVTFDQEASKSRVGVSGNSRAHLRRKCTLRNIPSKNKVALLPPTSASRPLKTKMLGRTPCRPSTRKEAPRTSDEKDHVSGDPTSDEPLPSVGYFRLYSLTDPDCIKTWWTWSLRSPDNDFDLPLKPFILQMRSLIRVSMLCEVRPWGTSVAQRFASFFSEYNPIVEELFINHNPVCGEGIWEDDAVNFIRVLREEMCTMLWQDEGGARYRVWIAFDTDGDLDAPFGWAPGLVIYPRQDELPELPEGVVLKLPA